MKKLTLKDIKSTAWNLSEQTEEERAKWQIAVSKLGAVWRSGFRVSYTGYEYFFIDDCGRLTYGSLNPFTPKSRKVMQYSDLVQGEVKLRVDFFLSVGGKFAVNDVATDKYGSAVIAPTNTVEGWSRPCDDDNKRTIESFASRESAHDGSLPVIFGAVSAVWKYDIEALIKMQIEHDAKPEQEAPVYTIKINDFVASIKMQEEPCAEQEQEAPVYTQEMRDDKKLPTVGMEYLDEEGQLCRFIGLAGVSCVVGHLFETPDFDGVPLLSACQLDLIIPIDTRTDEEKAIDGLSSRLKGMDKSLSMKELAAQIIKAGYKKQ